MSEAAETMGLVGRWGGGSGLWLSVLITLGKILAIVVPILVMVAYLTYWERKLIGWMHIRLGPNRVGPLGLLQPVADALKLMFKEVIVPTQADRALYLRRCW